MYKVLSSGNKKLRQCEKMFYNNIFFLHQNHYLCVFKWSLSSTSENGSSSNSIFSKIHPSKKVTATRLWSIMFIFSWICINQVRYPWKVCSFAFRLMPYLLGLFHWGLCRVSKLGAMSKRKSCKIDRIVWEMHAMSCFVLSFCECMHAYPLPIHCTEILRNKTSCWISNSGAILEHLVFDIASHIINLRTFLPGNHNK